MYERGSRVGSQVCHGGVDLSANNTGLFDAKGFSEMRKQIAAGVAMFWAAP
jgi:hypothetical protein